MNGQKVSPADEERTAVVQLAITMRDQPAGFVSRLIAFVMDLMIVSGVGTVAAISVGLILSFFNLEYLASAPSGENSPFVQAAKIVFLGLSTVFSISLIHGYPLFFWLLAGQTPGKAFVGLRVVSMDGRPLRLGQALRRIVGYWFSALPLFAGFLWVLIDDGRRGWHDKFARTQVVYAWEARMGRTVVEAVRERRRLLAEGEQKNN